MSKRLLDDTVLKLIDAKLVIDGNITSKDVYFHLGLCRQKVSRVFQDYLSQNPDAMIYVPSKKKYIATESFKPHFFDEADAKIFIDALVVVFGTNK
ncbi:putative uncharacterized protein (plasmid) [Aliivibrio wodanis]|uniref:DNA-binding transcriptional repressor CapW winged helix-turn-helix domain-containing protein n=1 Tax=Aliivibrio wodanis TaxID=80852 RepID=A0A090K2R7_9GAMM|nr:putative uncharacterized protein [Aliivibrio wodanis]